MQVFYNADMKRVLFGIFAHPDDEAFGPSGTLIQEVKAGTEVHLICATQGEAGNNPDNHTDLGMVRHQEWQQSAELIGARSCLQLGYPDGGLSNKLYLEIADKLKAKITEVLAAQTEPIDLQFITFDPGGFTGHLDHVAMSLIITYVYTTLRADLPKQVEKIGLRYFCIPHSELPTANTDWLFMPAGRPDELIDQKNDVSDVYDQKLKVVEAHRTQRDDAAMVKHLRGDGLKTECFYDYKD